MTMPTTTTRIMIITTMTMTMRATIIPGMPMRTQARLSPLRRCKAPGPPAGGRAARAF